MDETGISQRPLTDSDAAAYIGLVDAVCAVDGDDEDRMDEDGFRFLLGHPHGTLEGVFDGDRMIAFGWVVRRTEADPVHWMSSSGGVHPDYRGRGVGTRLLRWMVEFAPQVHERHFPGRPLEFGVGTLECNRAARELFEAEGFTPLRWFFDMELPKHAPVPQGAVPEGLELAPYTPELKEAVRLAHNEAFRDHWRSTPQTAETWDSWRARKDFRPELSFVMLDPADGAVAGYLIAASNDAQYQVTGVKDIHFDIIGTRRPYRRRGVAAALIAHAVGQSRTQGYETASLGVDAENPSGALGLYERLGLCCVRKYVVYNRVLAA